jgi:hypothetical protein
VALLVRLFKFSLVSHAVIERWKLNYKNVDLKVLGLVVTVEIGVEA